MKCRRVREYLLLEIKDQEAGEDLRSRIRGHLDGCAACRAYHADIQRHLPNFGDSFLRQDPPAHLWDRIEERISPESAAGHRVAGPRFWREFFRVPRPVLALACAMVFLLTAVYFNQTRERANAIGDYMAEQMTFLAYLENGSSGGSYDLDTSLEEFLM